jgi:hypothetical protein
MKRNVLCAAMVLLAGSLMAADKDDVTAAIAKLAASDNYSWKSTTTNIPAPGADANGGGGGRRGRGGFGAGTVDGKVQKDGLIYVSMPGRGGAVTEGYVKGTKGAIKAGEEGWTSLAEATADDGGGGFNFAAMTATRVQTTKSPAAQAKELLDKAKSITKADDAYSGDLPEDAVKALLSFGPPRGGGGGPEISGAKGSVKFWIKDGVLVKFETTAKGSMSFNDNDMQMNRVTTTEIKDVGATKIEVPAEAKKSLS